MTEAAFRPPTEYERALLEKLLSIEFEGREAAVAQIEAARVRTTDEHGCLEFAVERGSRVNTPYAVPVEGAAEDEDGVPVHVLLFVAEGLVTRLEIYKADGSPILQQPEPERLDVWAPPFRWPST